MTEGNEPTLRSSKFGQHLKKHVFRAIVLVFFLATIGNFIPAPGQKIFDGYSISSLELKPVVVRSGAEIERIFVEEGDIVKAGDILLTINPEIYRKQQERVAQAIIRLLIGSQCGFDTENPDVDNDEINQIVQQLPSGINIETIRQTETKKCQLWRQKIASRLNHANEQIEQLERRIKIQQISLISMGNDDRSASQKESVSDEWLRNFLRLSVKISEDQKALTSLKKKKTEATIEIRRAMIAQQETNENSISILFDELAKLNLSISNLHIYAEQNGTVRSVRQNATGLILREPTEVISIIPNGQKDFSAVITLENSNLANFYIGADIYMNLFGIAGYTPEIKGKITRITNEYNEITDENSFYAEIHIAQNLIEELALNKRMANVFEPGVSSVLKARLGPETLISYLLRNAYLKVFKRNDITLQNPPQFSIDTL